MKPDSQPQSVKGSPQASVMTLEEVQDSQATADFLLDLYSPVAAGMLVTQLAAAIEERYGRGRPMGWADLIDRYRTARKESPK